ncbi:MAG: molybdate ABC transporter permease subunit [Chloroflexi bacterium]|nr:MAG: molybdate ABC transporter permease subunit [Chloroflexota bacterium]
MSAKRCSIDTGSPHHEPGKRKVDLAALNPVSRIRNQPAGILGGGGAVLYVLFIGLPVLALLVRAAQQSDFLDAVTSDAALTALRLSLITSVISMAVVVLLGTPFAYLLARSDRLWARLMDSLVELPLVLPPVVAGVAMLMAFGRNGLIGSELESIGLTIPFTTTAVVFAQIFVASPFFIRSAKLGFQSVGKDYEDIAQTLGVSPWRTFFRITLPLAAPAMFTGLGLAWARALSEFGATMMFAGNLTGETQTMPLAIMSAMEKSLDGALALSVMLLAGSIMGLVLLGLLTRRRWQGRS